MVDDGKNQIVFQQRNFTVNEKTLSLQSHCVRECVNVLETGVDGENVFQVFSQTPRGSCGVVLHTNMEVIHTRKNIVLNRIWSTTSTSAQSLSDNAY